MVFSRSVTSWLCIDPEDDEPLSVLESTWVRSRSVCSGAATTKPHEARCDVRNVDCVLKPANPWLNTTSG